MRMHMLLAIAAMVTVLQGKTLPEEFAMASSNLENKQINIPNVESAFDEINATIQTLKRIFSEKQDGFGDLIRYANKLSIIRNALETLDDGVNEYITESMTPKIRRRRTTYIVLPATGKSDELNVYMLRHIDEDHCLSRCRYNITYRPTNLNLTGDEWTGQMVREWGEEGKAIISNLNENTEYEVRSCFMEAELRKIVSLHCNTRFATTNSKSTTTLMPSGSTPGTSGTMTTGYQSDPETLPWTTETMEATTQADEGGITSSKSDVTSELLSTDNLAVTEQIKVTDNQFSSISGESLSQTTQSYSTDGTIGEVSDSQQGITSDDNQSETTQSYSTDSTAGEVPDSQQGISSDDNQTTQSYSTDSTTGKAPDSQQGISSDDNQTTQSYSDGAAAMTTSVRETGYGELTTSPPVSTTMSGSATDIVSSDSHSTSTPFATDLGLMTTGSLLTSTPKETLHGDSPVCPPCVC